MPFPESPRVVFEVNPLEQVICQLRFPSILAVSAAEPAEFQERIRHGYPLYERSDGIDVPKDFAEAFRSLNLTGVSQSIRHTFATADAGRTISLTKDFLAIQESDYTRWESFRAEMILAKAALMAVYNPAFLTRVGLRYINVIDPANIPGLETESWRELLKAELVGELGAPELQGEVAETSSNTLIRIPDIRNGLVRLRRGLKADSGTQREVYVIDADFYCEERVGEADAERILDRFNVLVGNLFRWSISRKLHQGLRPMPVDERPPLAVGQR